MKLLIKKLPMTNGRGGGNRGGGMSRWEGLVVGRLGWK